MPEDVAVLAFEEAFAYAVTNIQKFVRDVGIRNQAHKPKYLMRQALGRD